MARGRISQQAAYILHTRAYRETSLLVDLFTREYGRFTVISKGCKRKTSRSAGLYFPFRPLLVSWAGKGELPILTGIEQRQHHPLPGMVAQQAGFYVNELLLKLLHRHDPHEALFDRYAELVEMLTDGRDIASHLRLFEKHLLGEIGFGLVLDHDVETGEAIRADALYHYYPDRGPVVAESGSERVIPGEVLIALRTGEFPSVELHRPARNLTRSLIDIQLGGRELRSRRISQGMRRYYET